MTIRFENISKGYVAADSSRTDVLNGVSGECVSDRVVALIGPNGCGKTTLLRILTGALEPDSGSVVRDSKSDASVAYVSQDFRSSLLPWLTVCGNLAIPLRLKGSSRKESLAKACDYLNTHTPLLPPNRLVSQLSGGQQQLLCLMRADLAGASFWALDEPTAALDQAAGWTVLSQIDTFAMTKAAPILMIAHDVDQAVLAADEIWLMSKRGEIAEVLPIPLERPRTRDMLVSTVHVELRAHILGFLFDEG